MAPCSSFLETRTMSMVESLVTSGEHLAMLDKITCGKEDDHLVEDPICGWGNSVCLPRQNQSRGPNVRRKASKQSYHPDAEPSSFRVRLVSEDFGVEHYRSAWKANVEPGTYRYIANNGHYRMTKFSSYGPDWVTVKRSRLTDRAPVSSLDIKLAHKLLKKDLDSNFKLKPVIESSNYEDTSPSPSNATEHHQRTIAETLSLSSRAGASCHDNRRPENTVQRVDSAPNLGARLTAGGGGTVLAKSEPFQDPATQHRAKNDAFSITPMARADTVLRPLEKLTPHQKRIDRRMSDPDRQVHQSLQTGQLNTFGISAHSKKATPTDLSSAQLIGQAENDILSRLRHGLHVSNKDDGKSVTCSFLSNAAINDYSRLLAEKIKAPQLGAANGTVRSLATQKRVPAASCNPQRLQMAVVGSNGAPPLAPSAISAPTAPDTGSNPINEVENWALPEISGKRITVAATLHQRIL